MQKLGKPTLQKRTVLVGATAYAKRLGISRQVLNRIINGKTQSNGIRAILEADGIELE